MNGFNHIPNKEGSNTFFFYANASGSESGSFQVWNKPVGASMVHFLVIGGGGGGGSGACSSSAVGSGSGGGGGAPAGMYNGYIPAVLLPNTIYLQVGYGGAGGASVSGAGRIAGNSGSAGTISYVCLYPEINSGSILIQSSFTTAPGGAGANLANTAAAGAAPAVTATDTNCLRWLVMAPNQVTTQTAAANGALSNATAGFLTHAGLLTGGSGGGGVNGITGGGAGNIFMTDIAASFGQNVTNGSAGFFSWKPFIATGGAGGNGGGPAGASGVSGGKGAYGCGGGGGGAGRLASGKGGDGGDGLIVITVS